MKSSRTHALAVFVAVLGAAAPFAACGSPGGAAPTPRADDGGSDSGEPLANDAAPAPDGDRDDASTPDDDAASDAATDALTLVDANGPPFPCGPTLECFEVTQFCGQVTGPHGGVFYDCNAVPGSCVNDVSCTCLAAQGISSPCSETDGGITVVAVE